MSHRSTTMRAAIVVFLLSLNLLASMFTFSPARSAGSVPDQPNIVLRWNEALVRAVREETIGPPMIARALAISHTCMFDAWAAYDDRAVGTQLAGSLRRPIDERTRNNKAEAISFAAYRAAVDLFLAASRPCSTR
jgi:hypothetical protein